MAVKRREQALQDYKRLQSKVEKYDEKEKTGPVMVKLHQVLPVCIRAHVKSAKTLVTSRGSRVHLLLHATHAGSRAW